MTMRKISFYLFLIVLMPLTSNAQESVVANAKKNSDYASNFGINSGVDNNINAYRLYPNSEGNNFYKVSTHYNIGIDYGWMVSKKFRPRIELKYVKMSYGVGWDNANISSIKESIVNLYNFDINFHMDYLLLNANKFQLFVSPALKWEFNIAREEKNLKYDGSDNWASYNGIISENPRNLIGGAVSTILKYNIIKNIGITLTPEYTLFFRNFIKSNSKCYQRTSVNFGVEFNFR
jgi:hypothetical protein